MGLTPYYVTGVWWGYDQPYDFTDVKRGQNANPIRYAWKELMDTIQFVRKHFDMTILLIEHDMKLVSGICERLTVLNFGQILTEGKTGEVLNNPEVIKAYLGDE